MIDAPDKGKKNVICWSFFLSWYLRLLRISCGIALNSFAGYFFQVRYDWVQNPRDALVMKAVNVILPL
jgi:hypothetical protein